MGNFLLILSLLASTNAFAAINKWVDAQGQVHYSDQPPPANVQPKKLRPDAPASGVDDTKTYTEREAELKRDNLAKQAGAEKAAQKKASEDALKLNCANAQENMRSLQSGVRMMEIAANGERVFLDDAQRQQRIAKSQQDINTYCK